MVKLKKSLVLIFALVLVLTAALVVSGCTPMKEVEEKATETVDNAETAKQGGTLRYFISEPAYIDPYNAQETEGMAVVHALFVPLTQFDPKDPTKVVAGAATEWSANEDATVWTFKLNPEGKFADGTPVTAEDFVYTWNRICNPETVLPSTGKPEPSEISYHLGFVKGFDAMQSGKAKELAGIKAVDELTFEVTLSQPFADFAYVTGHPALSPEPKALVEGGVDYNGEKAPYNEMPIGNGPFKITEPWSHDQYIKVARNENYALTDPANIDGIDFQIIKDPDTAYREFQAGNLDFTQIGEGQIQDAISTYGESADGYTSNPTEQVMLGAENATYNLDVNNEDKVLKDPKVREALSLAINRQNICEIVFEGTREAADNALPPGVAGYEKGAWPAAKYDVEAAKQALADAGYPDGKGFPKIKLAFNSGGGHEKIMELIQADLKKIGVESTQESLEWGAYLKKLKTGNYQIGRLGWVADYPIAYNFLYPLFGTESIQTGDNASRYSNKEVDGKIAEAEKTIDDAARIAMFTEVDKIIGADTPAIPVMFYKHHHVTSDRVHDFTFDANFLVDYLHLWIAE